MRQPIVIRTPYPTPEEVAKDYGVSRKRLKELGALVDEFLSRSSTSKAREGTKRKCRLAVWSKPEANNKYWLSQVRLYSLLR